MRVIAKKPAAKGTHLVRAGNLIGGKKKKQTLERASTLSPSGHNFIARISDIASNSLKSVIEKERGGERAGASFEYLCCCMHG